MMKVMVGDVVALRGDKIVEMTGHRIFKDSELILGKYQRCKKTNGIRIGTVTKVSKFFLEEYPDLIQTTINNDWMLDTSFDVVFCSVNRSNPTGQPRTA